MRIERGASVSRPVTGPGLAFEPAASPGRFFGWLWLARQAVDSSLQVDDLTSCRWGQLCNSSAPPLFALSLKVQTNTHNPTPDLWPPFIAL
jgi:hypothetical protein